MDEAIGRRNRHHNGGLKKRCGCGRRQWGKCSHPWHFGFHYGGTEYRFSLNSQANKPLGYVMPKTEAEALRDHYRSQIRTGTFGQPATSEPAADARLTFGDVADRYLEKHVCLPGRREAGRKLMEWYVGALRRAVVPAANGATIALERKPVEAVTTADVEAIREGWKLRTNGSRGGRVGLDRGLKRLRHLFNWAIEKGYADRTPFKRNGVVVVHFSKENPRVRRLEPGEEDKLLQHADSLLKALTVAALETGCRLGELLSLQWRNVKWDQNVLLLTSDITKTAEDRDVPMSRRLRALLEMRRHAPDGSEHEPHCHIFGNEVGEPVKTIRDGWEQTCDAAKITGLHFHDLRREFGSRLLESGLPIHAVRDWLGHANISQTSSYLKTTRVGLQQYLKRFEKHRNAEKRRKEKGRKFRTPFAQTPIQNRPSAPSETVADPVKLLN